MKRITTALTLGYIALANAVPALAQGPGNIAPAQPANGGIAEGTGLQVIIQNVITIIFTVAILAVLFYLILGAFNWITSGGDKEKIKGARGTIVHALIGLAILALAFVIVTIAGGILHVNFKTLSIPSLQGD